jgi:hypothetical protein
VSTPITLAAEPPPLSGAEKALLCTVAPAGVGVGGLGLASSFNSVSEAADRWGVTEPWMVPVGIDAAIPVFTALNLLLIRLGMPLAWVRFVPWALTAVTCWLNVAAGTSLSGKIAHGTMPLLWVGVSEVVAHIYAVRIGAATGKRMERVRRSRWLFAPRTTLQLWRRMVLWEITDYREALSLEKQRQLARAELRETYGRGWRRKAPRRDLVLLRLGELAPEGVLPTPDGEDPDSDGRPHPGAQPRARRRTRTDRNSPRMTWDEAIDKARQVTAGWPYEGLDAEPIRKAVGCSQDRSRQLRDVLRAERQQLPAPVGP